jgi:hypothetical protein
MFNITKINHSPCVCRQATIGGNTIVNTDINTTCVCFNTKDWLKRWISCVGCWFHAWSWLRNCLFLLSRWLGAESVLQVDEMGQQGYVFSAVLLFRDSSVLLLFFSSCCSDFHFRCSWLFSFCVVSSCLATYVRLVEIVKVLVYLPLLESCFMSVFGSAIWT